MSKQIAPSLVSFETRSGITQTQAARAMNIPRSRLSDMFTGRKGVSSDTALRCEKYLGISARVLIEMQARYDYSIAYHKKAKQIAKEVESYIPATA